MEGWKETLDELKMQLRQLREVCAKALPDNITLNYVPHDIELFRQVHKISAEDEEKLNIARYPSYNKPDPDPKNNPYPVLEVLHDIEQIKEEGAEQDPNKYGVIFDCGINTHEHLQNMQDSCIKANYLHGSKMWMQVREKKFKWKRNEPCYCTSGKKYKDCCIDVD